MGIWGWGGTAFQIVRIPGAKVVGIGAHLGYLRDSKRTSVAAAEVILGKVGAVIREVVGKQIT